VAELKIVSWQSHGRTKETHEEARSGYTMSRPRFELETYRAQAKIVSLGQLAPQQISDRCTSGSRYLWTGGKVSFAHTTAQAYYNAFPLNHNTITPKIR
jgi:hypothetical protein